MNYLVDPGAFEINEGYVSMLTGPGLGIEVDEERVREATKTGHNWKNPVWRNEDGTAAEW